MEFNRDLHNPKIEVTAIEQIEINEFKNELLSDLDFQRESDKDELLEEMTYYLTSQSILDKLHSDRLYIINELAFANTYYKANCFYIDENGLAKITEDQELFNQFYYEYVFAKESDYYAKKLAQHIIKVRLIEFIFDIESNIANSNNLKNNGNLDNQNSTLPPKSNHPIFRDKPSEQFFDFLFKEWFNEITTKQPLKEISFVFRIYSDPDFSEFNEKYNTKNITQLEFANFWNDNYAAKHRNNYKFKIKQSGSISLKTFGYKSDTSQKTLSKLIFKYHNLKSAFESLPTH